MSRNVIDELLKKYTKAELAVTHGAFQVVNRIIDTFLLSGDQVVDLSIQEIKDHGSICNFHQPFAKDVDLPGYRSGFEAGYAYGLAIIKGDNLTTMATIEAALAEGISRG